MSREFRLVLLEDSQEKVGDCWTTVLTCWMCMSCLGPANHKSHAKGPRDTEYDTVLIRVSTESVTFWIKSSHTFALGITAGSQFRTQERVQNRRDPVKSTTKMTDR
jgi:hypothetical protein